MQEGREVQGKSNTRLIPMNIYYLCWCPFHVFVVLYSLHKISLPFSALKFIVWLSNAYSAVNPFVYFSFNSNFEQEIKVIFGNVAEGPSAANRELVFSNFVVKFLSVLKYFKVKLSPI